MFSSDMGKIIELQGQYSDRVNRNATKLNKQLQFLVNIGEQIGGAAQKGEATKKVNADATQKGEANDHTSLIKDLKEQDTKIAKAMEDQKTKTDELTKSIKGIIESYTKLETSSGNSSTKVTELMEYLNKLKESNAKKLEDLNIVTNQLDDKGIKDVLTKTYAATVKAGTNTTPGANTTSDANTSKDTKIKGTPKAEPKVTPGRK